GSDTGPLSAGRPEAWGQPTPRQATPPPHPGPGPYPGPPPQQPPVGPRPGSGPGRDAPPPTPGSYADRIRADDLVPTRKTPPARGWRRALYRATFGLINLGPGPDELRQAELEARIRGPLRGHFKIGVMGKGGVGKTTVSASVGSVLAEL